MLLGPKRLEVALCVFFAIFGTSKMSLASISVDPWQQARDMGPGINFLYHDPIWQDPKKARFQEHERHLAEIAKAGFATVRINLRAFDHMNRHNMLDARWLSTLDWIVESATKHWLNVVLDEHDYETCGKNADNCRDKLVAFWRQIASRYRDAPTTVLFELLNEPNGQLDADTWNGLLVTLLQIIRESNPTRNIIVGPTSWYSFDALKSLALPEHDRHIIATVHYYEPMNFTHQGADWVEDHFRTGVTWGTRGDRQAIGRDFEIIAQWSRVNDRPIFIGEFGAYEKGDLESRLAYITAVARAAEAHGWPWAYWQFDTDFSAYDRKRGRWIKPILKALDLPRARAAYVRNRS